jgi:hypothetical protein
MMKKLLITASLIVVSLVSFSFVPQSLAHAAFDPFSGACQGVSDSSVCQDKNQSQNTTSNSIYGPNGIITKIVKLLALVVGIVAVIVIIIAGIRFAISGGDATKVATAKSTVLFAVVGLIVAAAAQSIVVFVLSKL